MDLSINRSGREKKFFDLAVSVIESNGLSLYDLEYISSKEILRVYISHKDKITANIEDCILIDKAFSEPFENEAWIPENITLEVSSPGIYRKIRTKEHLISAQNERVLVVISGAIESEAFKIKNDKKISKQLLSNKKFIGILENVGEESLELNIDDSTSVSISYQQIKKINLEPII